MKKCFFVTPIGSDDSPERKNSDTVLNHIIRPVCESLQFEVIRVDELHTVDKIDSTIIDYLNSSELVIIDLSYHKPNVFYEFGYRQALGLPLIPIITEGSTIPFDVTTLRTIPYVTNDLDKVANVKKKIAETIKTMDFDNPKTPKVIEKNNDSTLLLNILDRLDAVEIAVSKRNDQETERVAELMSKYSQPQQSTEAAIINGLFGPLLNSAISDPDAFKKLADTYADDSTNS